MREHLKKRYVAGLSAFAILCLAGTSIYFVIRSPVPTADKWPLTEDRRLDAEDLNKKYLAKLDSQVFDFQSLVEEALTVRAETLIFARQIQAQKLEDRPITGAQSDYISWGIQAHLDLRERFMHIVDRFKDWIEDDYDPRLKSPLRLKGIMLALASALTLYDNYMLALVFFEQNPELRRIINQKDKGYRVRSNELARITANYLSPNNRKKVDKAFSLLHQDGKNREWLTKAIETDDQVEYLDKLIRQSPSFQSFEDQSPFKHYANIIGFFSRSSRDTFGHIREIALNEISKNFGNTVGLIQTRHGKLFDNPIIGQKLKETLRPMDVLLEKTPFRLTDKLIPGHYGHVAIWVGSEEDLKADGIWDHKAIKPYHEDIRAGRSIIEALREGVVLSSLEHFLNVDDLAVLRPKKIQHRNKDTIVRAFRQLGKKYDFNFDVETRDKIVCSELAYMTYTEIDWQTENKFGRATISPDNVAKMASAEGPFDVALLYHNGKQINSAKFDVYNSLLESKH